MRKKIIVLLVLSILFTAILTACSANSSNKLNEQDKKYTTKELIQDEKYTVLDVRETSGVRDAYSYYTISIILKNEHNQRYYVSYFTKNANRNNKDSIYDNLALLVSGDTVKKGSGDYDLIKLD